MLGRPPKTPATAVPTPSAYVPPCISLSVASLLAPPFAIPEISPTVSIALTIDIKHMAIITVKLISNPYLNGSGKANQAAFSTPEKFTFPIKIAIK